MRKRQGRLSQHLAHGRCQWHTAAAATRKEGRERSGRGQMRAERQPWAGAGTALCISVCGAVWVAVESELKKAGEMGTDGFLGSQIQGPGIPSESSRRRTLHIPCVRPRGLQGGAGRGSGAPGWGSPPSHLVPALRGSAFSPGTPELLLNPNPTSTWSSDSHGHHR